VYDDFGRVNDVVASVLVWGAVQELAALAQQAAGGLRPPTVS
jgi:hypothetical protein